LPDPKGAQGPSRYTEEELEARVRQRTGDRIKANETLRAELAARPPSSLEQVRLAAIVEASTDFVAIATADGRLLHLNRAGRSLVQLGADKAIAATSLADYFPAWANQLIEGEGMLSAVSAGAWSCEAALLTRAGSEIPVSLTILVHKDSQRTVEFVAVVARDIAERKRAEEAHKTLLKEYRLIFDSVPALIWYKDCDNRILRANRPAAESMGRSVADLEGQSAYDLYPDEAAAYHRDDLDVVHSGRPRLGIIEQVMTGSGDKIWVQTDKMPYRNERGEIIGVLVFAVDITERHHAQEEVRKLNAELEQRVHERTAQLEAEIAERKRAEGDLRRLAVELARSNAELELFASAASHDLQEPLRMVSSYLDLLAQRYQGKLDERADRWIGFAVDGAARMKELIDDLLEFARVGTRGKPFTPTDCVVVFDHVLAYLRPAILERGARVTRGSLPTVLADATQLTQVLQNLVGNALKYCGPRPPEVHVTAERLEGLWRFAVRDNGIGIDPQFAERIFVIFQRLHTRDEYAGTGIGLALCKKIVERHGGRIWVESQPEQGATFYFTLPDRKEANDGAAAARETCRDLAGGGQLG
jgi:PAS domain S-box-containing protein